MTNVTAFVTYETPWFRCGGIAAVMGNLPRVMSLNSANSVIGITPYHLSAHPNNRIPTLSTQTIGNFSIEYGNSSISFTAERYTDANSIIWFFLKEQSEEDFLFRGYRHPYDLPSPALRRDAIIFGQAVAKSLPNIAETLEIADASWKLLLQDWEAATVAFFFVGRGSLHLTLHNSYDSYIEPEEFADLKISPDEFPGVTILGRTLPLIKRPIFTVSEQFALEFTEDILQYEVMAPTLQPALLAEPIVGIDNGPFVGVDEAGYVSSPIPTGELKALAIGDTTPISEWKSRQQAQAAELLGKPLPLTLDVWGNPAQFSRHTRSWIVMAGRDDPRQKGYDVAAAAVEIYLGRQQTPSVQFLFFPIPGDEDKPGLSFLQKLAEKYPRDVLVIFGIWAEGFFNALKGSIYGLMPSLYEPFGMANEFYLAGGCVGIARATGGSLQQIIPLRASAAFSKAVERRANLVHPLSSSPTGILFRERDGIPTAIGDWRAINNAAYALDDSGPDRVQERLQYTVFKEMATELAIAIEDAIGIFDKEKDRYFAMLNAGISHIQRTFSWRRAAREYLRYMQE